MKKAIEKEMDNVHVSFDSLKVVTPEQMREGKVKQGFKYIGTHMIFDKKMDSKFTHKSRLGAGRHKTAPKLSIIYSSLVTMKSVRL